MIPRFDDFFFPCLKCLSDGGIYTQELLRKYVIEYFKMSDEDAKALIRSGKKTQVSDRVSWTVSYFLQAGLIEAPKRGTYRITQFGEKFLQEHASGFDKANLYEIPSFAKFASGKSVKPTAIKPTAMIEPENNIYSNDSTPTDIMHWQRIYCPRFWK